jgi:hypothetical protein
MLSGQSKGNFKMAKKDQLWKSVGITNHASCGGRDKIRFGADFVNIIKRVSKDATRCDYVELPEPMDKAGALAFMASNSLFQSPSDQALIADKQAQYAPKAEKRVRVAKDAPSLDSIRARAKKTETSVEEILKVIAE